MLSRLQTKKPAALVQTHHCRFPKDMCTCIVRELQIRVHVQVKGQQLEHKFAAVSRDYSLIPSLCLFSSLSLCLYVITPIEAIFPSQTAAQNVQVCRISVQAPLDTSYELDLRVS